MDNGQLRKLAGLPLLNEAEAGKLPKEVTNAYNNIDLMIKRLSNSEALVKDERDEFKTYLKALKRLLDNLT